MAASRGRASVGSRTRGGHYLVIDRRTVRPVIWTPERRRVMSAQTPYLEVDAIGVAPTIFLLIVLLLTALGIVAHVAFA